MQLLKTGAVMPENDLEIAVLSALLNKGLTNFDKDFDGLEYRHTVRKYIGFGRFEITLSISNPDRPFDFPQFSSVEGYITSECLTELDWTYEALLARDKAVEAAR